MLRICYFGPFQSTFMSDITKENFLFQGRLISFVLLLLLLLSIFMNEQMSTAIFCKLEISAHWADLSKKSFVYHNTEWTPSTD